MSTTTPPQRARPDEDPLHEWRRLEQELGVRGAEAVLEMIRSLEAQLVALYGDLDGGST